MKTASLPITFMRYITFISLLLFLMFGCELFEKSFDVKVVVSKSGTYVWGFSISKNGDSIFSSSECGSGNSSENECVDFTSDWDVNFDSYVYTFEANEGDKIGVIANSPVFTSCYATFSTWIYADGDLQESNITTPTNNSDNTCRYISSCQVTL